MRTYLHSTHCTLVDCGLPALVDCDPPSTVHRTTQAARTPCPLPGARLMIVSNGPARGYVREQMNAPGQAGQDTGSQRTIGSGHTKRKKTRDCRANRGEADRLSFPPSASPVRPPVTPPEQPMTWFVIIFVELFWQLLFAFSWVAFLLTVSACACSLLMTIPESESAVRRDGKGNELGKGERGKRRECKSQ